MLYVLLSVFDKNITDLINELIHIYVYIMYLQGYWVVVDLYDYSSERISIFYIIIELSLEIMLYVNLQKNYYMIIKTSQCFFLMAVLLYNNILLILPDIVWENSLLLFGVTRLNIREQSYLVIFFFLFSLIQLIVGTYFKNRRRP